MTTAKEREGRKREGIKKEGNFSPRKKRKYFCFRK